METVSRNVWADVMKGLAMVFVVFGHANFMLASPFLNFHLAIFLFVSGWLSSYKHTFSQYFLNKVRQIYLPYVVTQLLLLLFHPLLLKINLTVPLEDSVGKIILNILCCNHEIFCGNLLAPIWFLAAFFFATLLCYWLVNWLNKKPLWLLLVSLIICGIGFLNAHLGWLHFAVNRVLMMQFFIILGYCAKKIDFQFNKGYIAILGLVFATIVRYMGYKVDLRVANSPDFILWQINTFLGIYSIGFIANWLVKLKNSTIQYNTIQYNTIQLLSSISYHSLFILCWHGFVMKFVDLLLVIRFGYDAQSLIHWGLVSRAFGVTFLYGCVGLFVPLGIIVLWTYSKQKLISARK